MFLFEQPSGKKTENLSIICTYKERKEEDGKWGKERQVGVRGGDRKAEREIGIRLYFLRYPWKQVGTNRYLHYPAVTVKEKDVGVQCNAQSFYPLQNIMTSFHLHNLNPLSRSCWILKWLSTSAVPNKFLHLRNKIK